MQFESYDEINEILKTQDYICVIKRELPEGLLEIEPTPILLDETIIDRHYFIHKKDQLVLNAFLHDIKIEWYISHNNYPYHWENYDFENFIENYDEDNQYRVKQS